MASLVETLPALRREAEGTKDAGAGIAPSRVLLNGETDALAAALLQQRIDDFAAKSDIRVGSEEILPAQPEGDLRSVAVRVTMTAPFQSLVGWLSALARSETLMVADELQLRGPSGGIPALPVDASLTVTSSTVSGVG